MNDQPAALSSTNNKLEDVQEKEGFWPYRVVEDDRITYFKTKPAALIYNNSHLKGVLEFYMTPRWYTS